jgi:hypothetical protein
MKGITSAELAFAPGADFPNKRRGPHAINEWTVTLK